MYLLREQTLSVALAFVIVSVGVPMVAAPVPGEASTVLQTRTDTFRSVETVEYSGGETQTRIQSTSLLKSVRSLQGETATYELSGNG